MKSQIEKSASGGRKSKILEWEILPPEEKQKRGAAEALFKWLALVMDEFIRVPGTRFRFGLDPIIGLVPGLGDTSSALVSAFALIQAARLGVPKILLARMSVNILLNEVIGIVPIIGDAFSFWFKSNSRNHQIIKSDIATPGVSRRSDWIFVFGVLIVLFAIVCIGLLVSFFVLREISHLLIGQK